MNENDPSDVYLGLCLGLNVWQPSSPASSSLCSKREKILGSEAEEKGITEKKLRLNKEQSALLEAMFKEHSSLNTAQKQALARKLKLRPRQVEVWFQNRRARTKLKQTEVDCERLRKYCERLAEENSRLERELRKLRSLDIYVSRDSVCPLCKKSGDRREIKEEPDNARSTLSWNSL